ncbi:L,D-transpeptidase family protein [Pedococcus ginsenosidimutans]|uniref:L,D-transpeptidase family protein n=1 Tax=Pedococcus ginsenosidimutans TaxID=490570 RepID=UPI0031E7A5AC
MSGVPNRVGTRARTAAVVAAATALGLLAAGCGSDQQEAAPATTPPSPTSTATTTTTAPPRTTTARPPSTTRATPKATHRPSATRSSTKPRPSSRPAPKPSPRPSPTPSAATCQVPAGVSAAQVVLVTSSGSSATVRACRRSGGRYLLSLGPYAGHVGRNGVSSAKREGDLRTPIGTFPLRGGFGVRADPGLAMGWFRVDSRDVWVDDSGSSLYNTHQRTPADGRWSSAEELLNSPAYDYAQVVGYNESRTPGRGSAIFFHVDLGHGTAGCISLPAGPLLAVMQWERPGAVMSIR